MTLIKERIPNINLPNARKNILEQEKARAQYLRDQGHLNDPHKHVTP